jgi:thiol:disulfide interchange protein
MRIFSSTILFFSFLFATINLSAQNSKPVTFSFDKKITDSEVAIVIKATLLPGIKLYAVNVAKEDLPQTKIIFDTAAQEFTPLILKDSGKILSEKDAVFESDINFYLDSTRWIQTVKLNNVDSAVLKGTISYMYKSGDEYIPEEENFTVFVKAPTESTVNTDKSTQSNSLETQSLWWIFLAAFAGGLLALLTPCVYSMIPVTVSFFTKRSKTKAEGIRNAILYASSIVVIFTLLGFLITVIFGPAALNNLATNWIANLLFFVLFVVFGFSFLGAFEINLPSSWTNKTDSQASTKSFLGIFFMALTLVLVSFSCTGPIIGNLLVLAAKGSYFGPLVGMLGFSIALALPFALFAFFPSKLNILGKAGGWLNAVKVTLGFLELALALKFLSNADLVKGWRLLDREVFISLWIAIFLLLGFYLLGKLKFHHDDELPKNDFGLPYLSVTRFMFALTSFAFAIYMIPGLWGAPLKGISAFVPPMGTQDFVLGNTESKKGNTTTVSISENSLPHPVKYYDRMKIYEPEVVTTYGMVTYFDYAEALAIARKLNKPLMLDFTGINCVNCRKMEGQVWSDPAVMKRLKEDFVIASLYVDVQNIYLPEGEQYFSKALNKKIETLGDKNADMQVSVYGANSQPYYFFLDKNEKRLLPEGYGYNSDIKAFIDLLESAKQKYLQSSN